MSKAIVIYARYSSSSQTEQSIEGQIRVCREYAESNGYTVIGEYIDRAASGTTDNRPEFLRMIKDAEKRDFEYVLCYKLDRFSRNRYDSVFYKQKLKEYGVRVISAMEAISDTQEGKLIEGILEMMAEMYSADLSQKIRRGIKESVLKGQYLGGKPPYGYKATEEKKIEIDEERAEAVRFLFSEYAAGKSKRAIIAELNAQGYRNDSGKPFNEHSFQNALNNKKYVGKFSYEGIVYSDIYPAIIDEATFERAQKRLSEHKHAPAASKATDEYILSGKAFCGYCGASLIGVSGTSKTKGKHRYYACSNRWKRKICDKSHEKKKQLEDIVVEKTLKHILTPNNIEMLCDRILSEYSKSLGSVQLKKYEKQLKSVETELDRCFEIILRRTSEEMTVRAEKRIKELEPQKAEIQREIGKIRLANKLEPTREEVEQWLFFYARAENRARLIDTFVNAVFVFDNDLIIFYNFDDRDPITYDEMWRALNEKQRKELKNKDGKVLILNDMLHQKRTIRTPLSQNIGFG